MGAIFGGGQRQQAPVAPAPLPPPPRPVTIGATPIDRTKQRRRSSLAGGAAQNRTLISDDPVNAPLGV